MIARVFPSRTKATPVDVDAYTGPPPFWAAEYDAIHVSVAFTWDVPRAEWLARQWERVAPVTIGGPGVGTRGEEFVPGRYIADGYTITSRGCPNRCWFCTVPKRDGAVRELAIRDGWNVLDDNLLATSREHFSAVVAMLARQGRRVEFTGGLEAARLTDWHVNLLAGLRPRPVLWFAYDTPDDFDPLVSAARAVLAAGWAPRPGKTRHDILRCYVLCGWPADNMDAADARMRSVVNLGVTPMAMLWRNQNGDSTVEWRRFQRSWARPSIIYGAGAT